MRRECSRQRLLLLAALLAALAHAVPHDRERRQRDKLLRGAGVIEVETTQMMDDTAPREGRPAAWGRDSPNNRALVPRVNVTEAAAPAEPTEPTQNDACRGKNQGADCSDALVADGFCNVIPMGRGVLTMCQQKGPCHNKAMGSACSDEWVSDGVCNGDTTTNSVWCEARPPCYGKQHGDDCSDGRTVDGFCNGNRAHTPLTMNSMWCEAKGPCHGRARGADCADQWTPDGFCNGRENGLGLPPSIWCERKGPCYGKKRGMDCVELLDDNKGVYNGICSARVSGAQSSNELFCAFRGICYGKASGQPCATKTISDGVCRTSLEERHLHGKCVWRLPPKLPCTDRKSAICGRLCNPFSYCRTDPDADCGNLPSICKAPGPRPCESYAHCHGWPPSKFSYRTDD